MAIMPKWSKECKECGRRYPTGCGVATCLACKEALDRVQKEPTVSEDEWRDLSFIHGRTIPGALSDEDREEFEREWEAMEEEAARRAPWWSVADLLGEGFPHTSDTPA